MSDFFFFASILVYSKGKENSPMGISLEKSKHEVTNAFYFIFSFNICRLNIAIVRCTLQMYILNKII